MATIDDTVGKLARVYDSQTDTWIPLVGSPVPHVHNVSSSPDVDITEPLIDNEILAYSTSASAFVNTDSPTFDVATIDTANIDTANIDIASIIQPSTTVKPLIIRSTAPQTAAVTAATASSGSVTYAITNAGTIFTAGDLVTISGINPSTLDDVRATVGSVSSGSVVIFSGKQGTYVSGGTATRIHANLLEIQNSAGTPTSTIRSDGSVTGELTGGLVHIETKNTGGAVSSLSFDNVFTTDYSTFAIVVKLAVSGDLSLRVRASGTDLSSSNYIKQSAGFNTTSFAGARGTTTQATRIFGRTATGSVTATTLNGQPVIIQNPAQADLTSMHSQVGIVSGGNMILEISSFCVSNTTSYDGFTIFPDSGTINGDVSVYAYKI